MRQKEVKKAGRSGNWGIRVRASAMAEVGVRKRETERWGFYRDFVKLGSRGRMGREKLKAWVGKLGLGLAVGRRRREL